MSELHEFSDELHLSEIEYSDGVIEVISPKTRFNTFEFLEISRRAIKDSVSRNGAVLLRGFKLNNASDFSKASKILSENRLMGYENRSTPRKEVTKEVFTSTEYPSDASIPLHNENSYTHKFPRFLYFFCLKNSSEGGETPLANSASIYSSLDKSVRQLFEQHAVSYIRAFGDVDLPWPEVFGTHDKCEVSQYCIDNHIEFRWDQDKLTIKETRPAVIAHPESNRRIWFNQAHLFHHTNLASAGEELLRIYGVNNLPRNACLGNGEPIDSEALSHIRETLDKNQFVFEWKPSDLLFLDNLSMAHGRRPYKGIRKILVSMSHSSSIK